MQEQEQTRLTVFTKDEWRDIARRARPDWTDEQFEEAWANFCEMKRRRQMQ